MSEHVWLEKQGSIGLIRIDNPPVNALSPGVPEGIVSRLKEAEDDDSIEAIVLYGVGRFIAGADMKFLGRLGRPQSRRSQDFLEKARKPVVAAIHGFALGGGLEVSMGCHYRIATRGSKLGLPEVNIGLLPGGGGTQRLPRLIGAAAAVEMATSGIPVAADRALEMGLIDRMASSPETLLEEAVAFAREIAGEPLRRTCELIVKDIPSQEAFRQLKSRGVSPGRRAPALAIEAIEAATRLSFEEGLIVEGNLFDDQVNSFEARAMRYAFFAERDAAKVVDLAADAPVLPIKKAAVIGAGTMGSGIAMAFADAGIAVALMEADPLRLNQALGRIDGLYQAAVHKGKITAAAATERMALISKALSYGQLHDCDLVVEAVFEDMNLKAEIFKALGRSLKKGALLASNTSALDIDALAEATDRPQDVVGAHFFSPANVMKLVEIVRGRETSATALASLMALAKNMRKIAVVCKNAYGFVANRSRIPFNDEMNALVEEGASPREIDEAMVAFGYPMGPFAVLDLAGGDVGFATRQRRYETDASARRLPIADRLFEQKLWGQKTGAGWFLYKEGDRKPHANPEADAMIAAVRGELGVTPRHFEPEEIVERILFASVNEILKILDQGIAQRPSDVDVMWLNGFGFPRHKGGVLFWAEEKGAAYLYTKIAAWHQLYGGHWRPAKRLQHLAETGGSLLD